MAARPHVAGQYVSNHSTWSRPNIPNAASKEPSCRVESIQHSVSKQPTTCTAQPIMRRPDKSTLWDCRTGSSKARRRLFGMPPKKLGQNNNPAMPLVAAQFKTGLLVAVKGHRAHVALGFGLERCPASNPACRMRIGTCMTTGYVCHHCLTN